jgi:hypothetical protein
MGQKCHKFVALAVDIPDDIQRSCRLADQCAAQCTISTMAVD